MEKRIVLNIPTSIKIVLWKNKNIFHFFLYNKNKKFSFYTKSDESSFFLDIWSNSIVFDKKVLNDSPIMFNKLIHKFFKSWEIYFFTKIKFKGKGFRIRFFKKIKLVKFFFGKSHKTFIFFKKIRIKRINKYKFILKNINLNSLNLNSSKVVKIRKLNVYTLRGIRKSKQIVFKRKGKKGTYI